MEGVEVFFSEKLKSFRIMSVGDCPAGIHDMKERGSMRLHGNFGETVGAGSTCGDISAFAVHGGIWVDPHVHPFGLKEACYCLTKN